MPLHRRRESITADEVIAKLNTVSAMSPETAIIRRGAIEMIEITITEICARSGILNERLRCVGGPISGDWRTIGSPVLGATYAIPYDVSLRDAGLDGADPIRGLDGPIRIEVRHADYVYSDGVLKYAARRE